MLDLNKQASILAIEGKNSEEAVKKTTVLALSAHQDDIEIMAFNGIAMCYGKKEEWFCGVTVTDGAGSPRTGIYKDYTDEEMKAVREKEQNSAAIAGDYCAQIQLKYTSGQVKDASNEAVVTDIANIILTARPNIILTHNIADKHDTHIAVVLRVIEALRRIKGEYKPKKVYGMEVWRSLDWMDDKRKVLFDCSAHPNVAAAVLGVYDSQIAGGKRYDLAAMGRRTANATFFESHQADDILSGAFGMDITPLIDEDISVADFALREIEHFKNDVESRLKKFGGIR